MRYIACILMAVVWLPSCQESTKSRYARLVSEWEGREVVFPSSSVFTVQGRDTVDAPACPSGYTVLSYVDSVGCTSCKLRLSEWSRWMEEVDSSVTAPVSFLFYFHPRNLRDMVQLIRRDGFLHPVCLDLTDGLNRQNRFPSEEQFHTFLLDSSNRVVAVGNPVANPQVKELYLKVMTGGGHPESASASVRTEVEVPEVLHDFGTFPMSERKTHTFRVVNVGERPLVLHDVSVSCGCTHVDYTREPVFPGKSAELSVSYTADHVGYFHKSVRVYCNAGSSPLKLIIRGQSVRE